MHAPENNTKHSPRTGFPPTTFKHRFMFPRIKRFALALAALVCIAVTQASAQIVDHGRESRTGVINFTDLANRLALHPEPFVRSEPENEEDEDEARPTARTFTDSSTWHRRTTGGGRMSFVPVLPMLPVSPSPVDTFQATVDNNTSIPPDTHGAVDSNYCVTTTNQVVRIQTRAGGAVSQVSLNSFFSPVVGGGTFDPRVHYDPYSNRWIIVAVCGSFSTSSAILIAVSQTSNPTGSWREYLVTADGSGVNWLDFPNVGFNSKWICVSGNLFANSGGAYGGAKVYMFNKANLYSGAGASFTGFLQTGSFNICPALTYDATTPNMFFAEAEGSSSAHGFVGIWKVSGAIGSESMTFVGDALSDQPYQFTGFDHSSSSSGDFQPQVGTTNKVQANDARIDQVSYMNGKLWFSHTVFLPFSSTVSATRCGVDWWQTDTLANPIQIGRIDDATGANFFSFPTLAVNTSNDALIGFSVMSATTHPSAAYALRLHTDPTDSIRPYQIYRHGITTYYKTFSGAKNRWGDYSGAAIDITNMTDFWTIQEAASSTTNVYDTWWAHVTTPTGSCSAPAAITGTLSVCAGSSTALADATSGGVWSSTSTGVAIVNSTTGAVTGVSAGTTIISYTVTGGCASAATVTVNPLPASITGTASVCVGLTTTLADATGGGTWTSGSTGVATVGASTGVVTGVAAGTSIISYTLSTGCRATTVVTVNANPAAIGGTLSACIGATATLTDATGGGIWTSGNTGVATIGSTTGIVTGVSAGTSIISYTLATGCRATATATINAVPAAISGGTTVCVGATSTLTDATGGGTWTSGSTGVATIGASTGVLTGVSAGTSIISYTLSTGCRATTIATINGNPASISGTARACVGGATTLTNTTGGGIWTSGSTGVATVGISTGVVTGVAAGTAVISYTLPTGCFTIVTTTINANPVAITGTTTLCAGATTTLTDGTSGGVWTSGATGVATIGSSSGVVTGVTAGTATITYTVSTGCSVTAIVTVNTSPGTITGTTSACAGATTTLGNTVSGGTWTSSNTGVATVGSSSGIVNGISVGTSIISYTLSTGCRATITVNITNAPGSIGGATNICAGASSTLTNSVTGGTWQSSDGSIATIGLTSGIVTGVAAGTAVITYSLGTGCTATTVVTIGASPAAITGTAGICVGAATTLTNTTTGGVWTSGATGIATIGSGTGVVSGVSAGTAIISYTLGSGCRAIRTVTVFANPAAIGGTTTLCAGGATTLTDATSGGVWISDNTGVATVGSASGVVSAIAAGTATISYTIGTGCRVTAVFTTLEAPGAITGTRSACAGTSTTLANSVSGGLWTSSNNTVATVGSTSGVVNGLTVGSTVISYTLTSGCAVTATVSITTAPATIGGASTVCTGATTTLTNSVTGGTWVSSAPAVATIGLTSGIVTGVAAGTTTITYSLGGGCTTTAVITVNATPGAIGGTLGICVGGSATLTNSTSGGTWVSRNTAVATIDTLTGSVTGVSAGTSVISYTVGGCRALATVTVYPATTAGAITGSSSVSIGSTITLSDAVSGGIWSSGDATIATVGSTTGIVTGVSAGGVTISYSVTGTCGTATATKNITVTAPTGVSPIYGTLTVCIGATTPLYDSAAGGTWNSDNTAVATIDGTTGVATGVSAGTATISYTQYGTTVTAVLTVESLPITGATSVCLGQTTTLSDATPGGYWSSGNITIATVGSATGDVTGVLSGITSISYTSPGGCVVTSPMTVNIASAITGSTGVCVGQTTTLSNPVSGGVWSSSDGSVATVGSASGVVSGVASGTVTISYTLSSGCLSTAVISVSPLSAITGPSSVCTGQTITLSNATSGGVWSVTNPGIATINSTSGLVTGIAGGGTTVTYTLGSGCRVTAPITVNTLSAITGITNVCTGLTTALSNGTGGGVWSSGDVSIATVGSATGVVTGVANGTVVISYTLSSGCVDTAVVTVNPLSPITGATSVCTGQTTTLSNATSGGVWTSTNPTIASIGSSSGIVTGIAVGYVNMTYTLGSGCRVVAPMTVNPILPISGVSAVCGGATTTLTNGTAGGYWSSSDVTVATVGSTSGVVTGAAGGGTATITYTVATGCYATQLMTVTANSPITGASSVCIGQTTTLSNAVSGGTWTSSNSAIASVGSATGVVSGVAGGVVTISYTVGAGCRTTRSLTVSALSAISGASSLCGGLTTTYTDATVGGTWSSSDVTVATIGSTTGVALGATSGGVATITYMLGTGCYATKALTVTAFAATTGPSGVCTGQTITLTNAAPGGLWTSSNTLVARVGSATGVVSGITGGGANISYTIGACRSVVPVTVSNLGAITGATSVCVGQTITLTTSGAGVWSSSDATVATVGSTTGVVTGVAAGSAVVSYTIGSGCSATTTITVNPLSAITGPTSVCVGQTVTLANATPGGVWTSGNGTIGTIGSATGIVTGVTGGTLNFSYTISGTGCRTYRGFTVNLLSAITGPTSVCAGQTVTLTEVGVGTWSSSATGVASIGATTGVVSGLTAGTTTISYILTSTGCTATRDLTVNPLSPITGAASVCTSTPITLSNATPGGVWASNNPTIASVGSSTGLVTGVAGGITTISYTIAGTGCRVTTPMTVNICREANNTVAVTKQSELVIVPNPNKGEFVLRGNLNTKDDQLISVQIVGLLGQVVFEGKIEVKGGIVEERIKMNDALANGIYILNMHSDTENKVFHFVLSK